MKLAWKDYTFVLIQVGLFVVFTLDPFPHYPLEGWIKPVFLGLALCGFGLTLLSLLQLNRHLSPFPTPKETGVLQTQGLYAFVRHPIYTGILLMLSGYAIYQGSGWKLGVVVLLSILFHFKAGYEERLLCKKFSSYPEYARRAGRFFPKWPRSGM